MARYPSIQLFTSLLNVKPPMFQYTGTIHREMRDIVTGCEHTAMECNVQLDVAIV